MDSVFADEPIKLTYEDYCAVPDDGFWYEMLDGVLSRRPKCSCIHQEGLGSIACILHDFVRSRKLGEVLIAPLDVLLSRHDIVLPDAIFVSERRRNEIITRKNIQGSPDLLVEVLMPESFDRDMQVKRKIYARCGVSWYWLVDPQERTITELELTKDAYAVSAVTRAPADFCPKLFPGLKVGSEDLWE